MNNQEVENAINHVRQKNDLGIVTPNAIYNELGNLSTANWQEAAKIFSRENSTDNFYLTYNNDGIVNLHNDMAKAHKWADHSTLYQLAHDPKLFGISIAGLAVIKAVTGYAPLERGAVTIAAMGLAYEIMFDADSKTTAEKMLKNERTINFIPRGTATTGHSVPPTLMPER